MRRAFDPYFVEFGQGLPVPFLRALAKGESNFDVAAKTGQHWGLLQVSVKPGGVLESFNKAHGTSLTKDDMLSPGPNVRVASWYLRKIIDLFNASKLPQLKGPNWLNREWTKMLLAGWNSGPYGVLAQAHWNKAHGVTPIDHGSLFRNAPRNPDSSKWLDQEKVPHRATQKFEWQRAVEADFYKTRHEVPKSGTFAKTGGIPAWLILLGLYLLSRR